MSTKECGCRNELIVRPGQAVIMIVDKDDPEITRYMLEEDYEPEPEDDEELMSLFGAWSDLDWEETERALDRIRHESVPTPPIVDL
jgi:hypothetical protein